jgi:NADP-dependent 3-hydroxy acid dehydrogenase YdfG
VWPSGDVLLAGTVALVTGASSGIGAATAAALAGHGAQVAIVARRKDRLDDVAARIGEQGGSALALEADITDSRQAGGAVEWTVGELGRLDTLVSNAGIMLLGPALDTPLSEWERMVALNVLGTLYVTHAALPHLVRAAEDWPRRVADIVTISSTAGRVARPGAGVYVLTKFGIAAFAESLRQELIARHVRVSQVESIEPLRPEDIADAVARIVTSDRRVAINEVLVRAAEQTW